MLATLGWISLGLTIGGIVVVVVIVKRFKSIFYRW